MPVELPVNLQAHYKILGGGRAAGEAAGEEEADLAEAEVSGAVPGLRRVLPRAAHGGEGEEASRTGRRRKSPEAVVGEEEGVRLEVMLKLRLSHLEQVTLKA